MCPWPGGAGPSAPTRRAQSCQHKRGTKRCPALGRRAKLRRELYIWQSWSDSETTESEIRSCQHVERVATCRIQQAIARRNRRSESFSVRAHVTPPTKPRWAIPRTEPSSRGYLLRGSACHSRSGRCCTKKVCGMLEHVGLCGSAQRAVWKRSTCLGIDARATGFGTVAITSHLVVCRTVTVGRTGPGRRRRWPSLGQHVERTFVLRSLVTITTPSTVGAGPQVTRVQIKECTPTLEAV